MSDSALCVSVFTIRNFRKQKCNFPGQSQRKDILLHTYCCTYRCYGRYVIYYVVFMLEILQRLTYLYQKFWELVALASSCAVCTINVPYGLFVIVFIQTTVSSSKYIGNIMHYYFNIKQFSNIPTNYSYAITFRKCFNRLTSLLAKQSVSSALGTLTYFMPQYPVIKN